MFGWGADTVTVDGLAGMLGEGRLVLIDVREPSEYATGHIKGAVNVPLGQLVGRLGEFDPHAETYVICRSGHRSRTAAQRLKRAGFENVHNVKGGTSAWRGRLVR